MPGIIAIIDKEVNELLLHQMVNSIKHEKWHKTDIYMSSPLAIARVHIDILNPEKQPIFNEDNSAFIFMDGEIYDYEIEKRRLELKGHVFRVNNDAEYCLHLYEDYGESFIEKLEGSFIIVIYNIKNGRILIANDKHALRQLYHYKKGNKHIFSSEVKAILQDKTFNKAIDHKAVADYFAFGRLLGQKTFFEDIKAISPATIVVWSKGEIYERKYWHFSFTKDINSSFNTNYYTSNLAKLIRKAAQKRTRDHHRFGLFLSGGLDSRTVAAALSSATQTLATITYGMKMNDETRIAEKVACTIKAKHLFVELRRDFLAEYAEKAMYYTDGMLSCAHIWLMSLLSIARENVDIVFHGTGLDILLGTYLSRVAFRQSREKFANFFLEKNISKADSSLFLSLLFSGQNSLISSEVAPYFYSANYYKKVKDYPFNSFKASFVIEGGADSVSRTDYFHLASVSRFHLSLILVRNFIEDRSLGLDSDFFDFASRIPTKLRWGYKLYYRFFAQLSPELAMIPYQRTGLPLKLPQNVHTLGYLAKGGYKVIALKIRQKTKGLINLPQEMGYPDLNQLIRKDRRTREFFQKIILDQKTLDRGYFNKEFITKMVTDHMTGESNWGEQLCALLTFELWHRRFIDS